MDLGGPPRFDEAMTVKHRFRFVATGSSTDKPVYGFDLLGLSATATSTTGTTADFAAVKIHSVTLYVGGTTGQNFGLNWQGQFAKPSLKSDGAVGTAEIAKLHCVPPKGSGASFWVGYTERSNTLFTLSGPTGMTVDVVVSAVINNATKLSNLITYPSSGLLVGAHYLGPLDKQSGSPVFIPVSPAAYYG